MAAKHRPPRSILITGASSGIGEGLARLYAEPGIFLALSGRDGDRLEAVAAACRKAGAEVTAETVDVCDRAAMAAWVTAMDEGRPLDLVVANAGISAGTSGTGDLDERARDIFAVNLAGVLNTVHPVLPRMRKRRRGQVALMSSVAGFRGLPGTAAYAASKAAVKSYGEGLRPELADGGIRVSVICPGFVESRMTAVNRFPMPFLMTAEKASRIIRRGLARNRARIVFPWRMHVLVWLLSTLPPAWIDPILRRAPRKR